MKVVHIKGWVLLIGEHANYSDWRHVISKDFEGNGESSLIWYIDGNIKDLSLNTKCINIGTPIKDLTMESPLIRMSNEDQKAITSELPMGTPIENIFVMRKKSYQNFLF